MAATGFLGLGVMGSRMAARLVESGQDVVVWNRSAARCEPLRLLGARVASTPAEVVTTCKQTFGMLSDPDAALDVVFGKNGVLGAMQQQKAYIDCSTVDAVTSGKVAQAIQQRGGGFLASPVSGGWRDAVAGKLLFLAAGDKAVYDDAAGCLEKMGERSWYLGSDAASAARAKLCLQVMMGTMVGALGEAHALSDACGVDPAMFHEIFGLSAMRNPLLAAKGNLMLKKDYSPNFQIYLQEKDLRLATELAAEKGVHAPITAAAFSQYQRATTMGLSDKDFAAVMEAARSKL